LKFDGNKLNPAVLESLQFHSPGNRSYFDILKGGVDIDYAGQGDMRSVFFVMKEYRSKYRADKINFKKKFYMKKYFVCNFLLMDGKWYLTEDLCFTEGEIE
jgi:hypothetical protein